MFSKLQRIFLVSKFDIDQFTKWAIVSELDTLFRTWWRHEMETFSALLAICAGNSPVADEFPAHRPVTRSFDAFFDLCLNKRLSKQSWGWWFEMPARPLWRHCNDTTLYIQYIHVRQDYLSNTGAIIRCFQCLWSSHKEIGQQTTWINKKLFNTKRKQMRSQQTRTSNLYDA